jgi:hypothetical protein
MFQRTSTLLRFSMAGTTETSWTVAATLGGAVAVEGALGADPPPPQPTETETSMPTDMSLE